MNIGLYLVDIWYCIVIVCLLQLVKKIQIDWLSPESYKLSWKIMYFQYDYGLFHESVTHLARLWLNYVHKCICEVDFDQKYSYLWVLGLTTWTFAKYCFWSFRELYELLLFDIVSFHLHIFVFVWSEKEA